MLWKSLRAVCKAPGGAGSIWKYIEALVRATGVSVRFGYGFRTELHFADVWRGTPEAKATFSGQLDIVRMKGRQTILGGCCTQCML
jgi:hypothetical protein